jgi:hypothetical protein
MSAFPFDGHGKARHRLVGNAGLSVFHRDGVEEHFPAGSWKLELGS